jgi:hypothetical protein
MYRPRKQGKMLLSTLASPFRLPSAPMCHLVDCPGSKRPTFVTLITMIWPFSPVYHMPLKWAPVVFFIIFELGVHAGSTALLRSRQGLCSFRLCLQEPFEAPYWPNIILNSWLVLDGKGYRDRSR